MADDFDRTRGEAGDRYRKDRLGITGQTQNTHSWPGWLNWVLPLAAVAGLLWYLTAPDRTAQQYREPARTTAPSGPTTAPGGTTTSPGGTTR